MYRQIIGVLLCWVLLLPMASALELEATSGVDDAASLAGYLAVRCVADGSETIDEVAAPARAAEFVALPALLSRGYTRETCWVRFSLQRAAAAPLEWLLEVGLPNLDEVTLFAPLGGADRGFSALHLGDRLAYADRPLGYRHFIFPVHLPVVEPATFYLRIRTSGTMLLSTLALWQYSGLLDHAQAESALHWGFFGILALGILSYLMFWLWLRERIYGLYTTYLAAVFLMTQSGSGLLCQWLLPNSPLLADRLVGVSTSMTLLTGLLFFDEALGFRRHFPRWARMLFPLAIGVYLLTALAAAAGHYEKMIVFQQPLALLMTVVVTFAGPWLIWHGVPKLRLYTIAFSTQLMMAIAVLGRNLGLWATIMPLDAFILGTTTVHVVLLNFLLADRVRKSQEVRTIMEREAARLELEQQALSQQQGFMSLVAHEFRTPLAIIDISAQRMANSVEREGDSFLQRCMNIRAAVQRLTALMDEFLTLDRMEGAVRRFVPVKCAINEIVDATLAGFPAQRVDVRCEQVPAQVLCDPAMLRVALANLLSNALRYSPPDSRVQLIIAGGANDAVVFSVCDDGPGVPADELPKLFDKYFRGRSSQSQPGAGLGLFLVAQVATAHGGSVTVQSSPGQGSKFVLTLPNTLRLSGKRGGG